MSNGSSDVCEYYRDHDFYLSFLHVTAVISNPLNMFTTYVILRHSPPWFKGYKWHLLVYHISSWLLDFAVSVALASTSQKSQNDLQFPTSNLYIYFQQPVPFLPYLMGYFAGIFIYLPEPWNSGLILLPMLVLCLFFLFSSVVLLFLYRSYVVVSSMKIVHIGPTFYKAIVCCIYLVYFIPHAVHLALHYLSFYLEWNGFLEVFGLEYFFKIHPCLNHFWYEIPGFVGVNLEYKIVTLAMIVILAQGMFMSFVILFCICLSFWVLTFTDSLSLINKTVQRKLFVALMVQTFLPLAVILFPLLLVIRSIVYRIPGSQGIGDAFIICLSLHGTLSSIAILLLNVPYCAYIQSCLRRFIMKTAFGQEALRPRNQVSDSPTNMRDEYRYPLQV